MERYFHVQQCFHAVGHGTFFTGLVWDEARGTPMFSWAYDCGSKSTTSLTAALDAVNSSPFIPDLIDLLVISHFDNDHVNGVKDFLQSKKIRWLAVPYLDLFQQAEQIAIGDASSCSASTALFQHDPVRWLKVNGLSEQVNTIIFVKGDSETKAPDEGPKPDTPHGPLLKLERAESPSINETDGEVTYPISLDDLFQPPASTRKSGIATMELSHSVSFGLGEVPIEFKFFNSDQPDLFDIQSGARVARISRAPIEVVQTELEIALKASGLDNPATIDRKWRFKFKEVYERHFGRSGMQKNNISLCLMVQPIIEVQSCGWFPNHESILYHSPKKTDGSSLQRSGLLCLGDLKIDFSTISSMQFHYGIDRWDNLAVVQVPHHGSKDSWTPGVAAKFASDHFVHCVPDRSGGYFPHKFVSDDLSSLPTAKVHRADYRNTVTLNYHFSHCPV